MVTRGTNSPLLLGCWQNRKMEQKNKKKSHVIFLYFIIRELLIFFMVYLEVGNIIDSTYPIMNVLSMIGICFDRSFVQYFITFSTSTQKKIVVFQIDLLREFILGHRGEWVFTLISLFWRFRHITNLKKKCNLSNMEKFTHYNKWNIILKLISFIEEEHVRRLIETSMKAKWWKKHLLLNDAHLQTHKD